MKKIKVSIITVCYNSEKTMKRTLDSIANQTYNEWEHIIIDGKSTDKTIDICKAYQNEFPQKVVLTSEPDNGIYDAMNKGLKKDNGEIVAILNSDDWYEVDALDNVVKEYVSSQNDCAIFYGMCNIYQNNSLIVSGLLHPKVLDWQMMYHPAIFLTQKAYDKIGYFNTKYRIAADYDLMLRARKESISFIPINKIITNFPDGGASDNFDAYYDALLVRKDNNIVSTKGYLMRRIRYKLSEIIYYLKRKGH